MTVNIKGYQVEVDEEDSVLASESGWCRYGHIPHIYFVRARGVGRQQLHRLIIGANRDQHVDHANGDTLDNRRANLRIATNMQNGANRGPTRASTSGIKGVYWDKRCQKWMAQMMRGRKAIFLGRFLNKTDAAIAYRRAAVSFDGVFFHE